MATVKHTFSGGVHNNSGDYIDSGKEQEQARLSTNTENIPQMSELGNLPAGVVEQDFDEPDVWQAYIRYVRECEADDIRPMKVDEWLERERDEKTDV